MLTADDVRAELEPVDPERLRPQLAADEADGAAGPGTVELVHVELAVAHYIRKMPNVVSGTGAFCAAESQREHTPGVERVDDAVVPESCSRVVGVPLGLVGRADLVRVGVPTIDSTVAACSPPITEIRAFGHIQSCRGP